MRVKILDFGQGVFVKASASVRQQSKRVGTEIYSSPEVLLNRKIDHKVDVWSFGMTLSELWSGIPPWKEPAVSNITEAIWSQMPPALADTVPATLKTIVSECWMEERKYRPEFVAILRELCDGKF